MSIYSFPQKYVLDIEDSGKDLTVNQTRCSYCGAPLKEGNRKCEYCDTEQTDIKISFANVLFEKCHGRRKP